MTPDRLAQFPKAEFITLWNRAASIDQVLDAVCRRVGRVPKWAVMAWAVALRKRGADLKRFVAAAVDG